MEHYPRTLREFQHWFGSEDACRAYLVHLRWPDGFRCPRCQHEKAWLTRRQVYHCQHCGGQTSVTAGTIFQDTRKPLRLWFEAIWYLVNQKNGVSALGLQRMLGFSRYETVWGWLHKLRTAMVRPGRECLSGTVEVDETFMGGPRTGKRGRGAAGKTLVLIAVEDRGPHLGRIRLRRVADATAPSLLAAVQAGVERGSVVRTDGWRSYTALPPAGYRHVVVRPTAEVGENLLPLVNRVAALLKRWLQGTHQGAVRPSHLDYYLDEFTFRFNRRTSRSRGKLFFRLVQQAVAGEPVTQTELRGFRSQP
jgi:transposase-like protein